MRKLRNLAGGLLLALPIHGCAGSGIQAPATTELLDKTPRVNNSTRSPCWQQREIAAQNSFFATIALGREVIYKAPCDVDQKKRAPQKDQTPTAVIDSERARRTG